MTKTTGLCIANTFLILFSAWLASNKLDNHAEAIGRLDNGLGTVQNYILEKNKPNVEDALYELGLRFKVIYSIRQDGKFDLYVAEMGETFEEHPHKGKCIGTFNPKDNTIDLKEDCELINKR